MGGKSKAAVGTLAACYQDLDLHGERLAEAQAALLALPAPPSLIVNSGRGLHPIWSITPSADKARWQQAQRGLAAVLRTWAPDDVVVGDEARVLRLVPFPNCKEGRPRPTALLHQSDAVYTLEQLLAAYPAPPPIPRRPPLQNSTGTAVPPGLQGYAERGVEAGKRNACAFWLACRLVEEVADPGAGRAALEVFGRKCSPALPPHEVHTVWDSARHTTSYDPRKARHAPPPPAGTYQPDPAPDESDPAPVGPAPPGRPLIRATDEIHLVRNAILSALQTANEQAPVIFQRGRALVRVVDVPTARHSYPLIEGYSADSLRPRVGEVAQLVKASKQHGGDVATNASRDQVSAVLQADRFPFPVLDGLVEVPFVRPDGTICDQAGYDRATRLIYHAAADLRVPAVPAHPTAAEMAAARALIVDELMGDFPFSAAGERANAVALFLLPAVRPLIAGPTPLHLVESPTPGSGKSLLVEALLRPAVGDHLTSDSDKADEEETGKWITAKMQEAAPVLRSTTSRRGSTTASWPTRSRRSAGPAGCWGRRRPWPRRCAVCG